MQVHYNCHIKTMSYAVKRQGEIKSFQFLFEGSCADFVSDVSRESIPCGRARKRERSLAEFCSKAWHVIQATVSRSQTHLYCRPSYVIPAKPAIDLGQAAHSLTQCSSLPGKIDNRIYSQLMQQTWDR